MTEVLAFTRMRGNLDRDGGRGPRVRRPGVRLGVGGSAPVALPLNDDDVGVVDDAVDERGGAHLIGEDVSPLQKRQIGSQDEPSLLIPSGDEVVTAAVLTHVVRSMALAWEPDWAMATSRDHRDILSEEGDTGTFVGWVTYLSRRRGVVPPLPAPARIELVEDRGTLVVLTSERLTASNPAHVELGQRVRELLDRARLMQPVIVK